MSEDERDAHRASLLRFCATHDTDPDTLLARWQEYPDLTLRRRHGSAPPQLAVESFLVHNGVNVFGDIVCMPRTPEQLAAQGKRFVPDRASPGPADPGPGARHRER